MQQTPPPPYSVRKLDRIGVSIIGLHIGCLSNKMLTTCSKNGPEVTIKQDVHLALNCEGSQPAVKLLPTYIHPSLDGLRFILVGLYL